MKDIIVIFFLFCLLSNGFSQDPYLVIPKGHTGGVTSLCFSANGKYILSGSRDYSAKLWDLSAHEIQTYLLENEVQAIAISNNNEFILTGSTDGLVKLWKITGELLKTFSGHKNYITSLAFSPDGKQFISGSEDYTIKLWDINGNQLKNFKHTKTVTSLDYSSDGKTFLSGSEDKTAVLWNVSGLKLKSFIGHKGGVHSVKLSANGKYVLTSSADNSVILWDKNGLKLKQIKHFAKVTACDISSNNQHIISGSFDGMVKIWNTSGKILQQFYPHDWGLSALRFSPDGNSFISGSEDGAIRQWDLKATEIKNYKGFAKGITATSFSPDGKSLLTACSDFSMKYWDVANNSYRNIHAHNALINSIAFSPEGNYFLSGSEDKTAKLWDLKGNVLKVYTPGGKVSGVAFSPDGKSIFTACFEGCSKLWDVSGNELGKFTQSEKVSCAAFSPDGKSIATGSYEGVIRHFDLKGNLIKAINVFSQINSLVFSSDSKNIISGNFNGLIQYWDALSGDGIQKLGNPGEEILSISASRTGNQLAAGSNDGLINLWNAQDQTSKNLMGHSTKVYSLSFSSDGNFLASGSADGTVKIWNAKSGEEVLKLISLDTSDWVVVNPKGLFDASPGAMQRMNYQQGLEVIELDQLKDRYYEPGLLGVGLGVRKSESRNVSSLSSESLYPEMNASIKGDELNIQLKERSGGIGKLSFFINQKEVVENLNNDKKVNLKVNLNAYQKFYFGDTNLISLKVYNAEGWLKSQAFELQYISSSASRGGSGNNTNSEPVVFKGKPTLFALVVGTSDYSGDKLDLRFPDLDAIAIAGGLKEVGSRLFEDRLHMSVLTSTAKTPNDISSKKNIETKFKEYAEKATPGDVLIVYFSGHGMTYGEAEKSQFYYLTKDIIDENLSNPDTRITKTVSSEDLTKWLTAIPARKQVMIFDACHSGKVVESLESVGSRDLSPSQIRALDRMKDRTGMFILTGSAADKVSFEASKYGQGLLTYSLLQGMSGLALTEDKRVDVATLFTYARDQVPILARGINKIQVPVVAFPKGGGSFDIGIVDSEVKISLAQPKPVFIRNVFQDENSLSDPLRFTDAVSDYFRNLTSSGADAELIYIDVNEYNEAYSIKGLYKVNQMDISLRAKLFFGPDAVGEIQLTGKKSEIPKMVEALFNKIVPMIKM